MTMFQWEDLFGYNGITGLRMRFGRDPMERHVPSGRFRLLHREFAMCPLGAVQEIDSTAHVRECLL